MKHLTLAFALLLCMSTAFAQKPTDPCKTQKLVLNNSDGVKFTEGEMPRGKVAIAVMNSPKCDKQYKYDVAEGIIYHVRGTLPLQQIKFKGSEVDFTELEKSYQPGDRIVFEIKKVNDAFNNGEVITNSLGTSFWNWPIQ